MEQVGGWPGCHCLPAHLGCSLDVQGPWAQEASRGRMVCRGVYTLQEHLPRGIQATIWDEMAQGGRGGEAQMSAVQAWAWPQLGHGEREGVAVREGQRGSGEQGLAG